MPRRVLILLSQSPFDAASGPARSMLSAGVALAARGFDVRVLGTTASEAAKPLPALQTLRTLGLEVDVDRRPAAGHGCPVWRLRHRGAHCTLMETGTLGPRDFDFPHGLQFTRLLAHELAEFRPEIVYTYGGTPPEQTRRELVRDSGAAVVFALSNLSYLHPLAFDQVDAVVVPSAFLRDQYHSAIGLESHVIPPLIERDDVVCDAADATLASGAHAGSREFVYVNPTPNEGVYFFVRLAHELALARPDIPLRVFEARGRADHLHIAAAKGNIDLRGIANLRISPLTARPSDLYANARSVLLPVAWPEPFGRVAIEAALNGVPTLAGRRGGLPEALGDDHDAWLPLPDRLTPDLDEPATADEVRPWVEAIIRMHDDGAAHAQACAKARSAGAQYLSRDPGGTLSKFFEHVTHVEQLVPTAE